MLCSEIKTQITEYYFSEGNIDGPGLGAMLQSAYQQFSYDGEDIMSLCNLVPIIENNAISWEPMENPDAYLCPDGIAEVPQVAYRYGFNGMEKDDEIKGSGNSLDFGARIYDN